MTSTQPPQNYVGIKLIQASPADKDGQPGYNVIYPDGYASWSPKEAFEIAYLPIVVPNSLTQRDIDSLTAHGQAQQVDPKTTLLKIELKTGFVLYETSACVDPANYFDALGAEYAMKKINDKIWFAMGFILQWAKYGLKHTAKSEVAGPSIGAANESDSDRLVE